MNCSNSSAATTAIDPVFVELATSWMNNPGHRFLNFIWLGYENMRTESPTVDSRDLERSITQLLEPRVRDAMSGDEPFYVQHGPFERETMKRPPAQPPEYDLAFIFRADERIMWPIEAKVLERPSGIAEYVRDVNREFLTCRYGPFANSGAMLGYLLSGHADEVFEAIECKLDCILCEVKEHPTRPNRVSQHSRKVPGGKAYPRDFHCYHLVLGFLELSRWRDEIET